MQAFLGKREIASTISDQEFIARQTRSGVAVTSMWSTPNSISASTIALATTAGKRSTALTARLDLSGLDGPETSSIWHGTVARCRARHRVI